MSAYPTLNPTFARNGYQFKAVSLRSSLTVLVMDRRSRLDWKVLGEAVVPCAAVPGSDPVYMWVPLARPEEGAGALSAIKVGGFRSTPLCVAYAGRSGSMQRAKQEPGHAGHGEDSVADAAVFSTHVSLCVLFQG